MHAEKKRKDLKIDLSAQLCENISSGIQFVFLRKPVLERRTDVTSFCMQFENRGHGLLKEAFWSEGESVVG